MRTTIHVDDGVVEDILELTHAPTTTEAVRSALLEYVRLMRKAQLLAMRGSFDIESDCVALRSMETAEVGGA